jgi:drug/metabolite transporter (DMT)-like permease
MVSVTNEVGRPGKSRSWLFNYFGAGLIWGSSFFFIEFANQSFSPIGLAFWRCLLGAITLLLIVLFRKINIRRDGKLFLFSFIVGAFNTALPFTLFAFGEHHVSSAFAGMANAITPVATVIALLTVFRHERVTRNQIIGLGVGVIGVLTLIGAWQGIETDSWYAVIAVVIAATCYGFGGPFIRRFISPLGHPLEVAAFGQIAGAAILLAPIYFSQPLLQAPLNPQSVSALMVLGIMGTGVAYTLYYPLLKQVGSAISSSVTLITPLIAVSLGVIFLGEELRWYEPVGGIIILLGAAIAQGLLRSRKIYGAITT